MSNSQVDTVILKVEGETNTDIKVTVNSHLPEDNYSKDTHQTLNNINQALL